MLRINTHKLVICSWPNTHDAVKYQSRCTRSALTGTAYIRTLRHQPHTGYQGPSTAHIATTAWGEVRHCRGLWGINICPPSLAVTHHYSYHHQCNVCVHVCPMFKWAKEGIARWMCGLGAIGFTVSLTHTDTGKHTLFAPSLQAIYGSFDTKQHFALDANAVDGEWAGLKPRGITVFYVYEKSDVGWEMGGGLQTRKMASNHSVAKQNCLFWTTNETNTPRDFLCTSL